MLFSKSKGPKLKAKHPELSQTEMAVKLGEGVVVMVRVMLSVGGSKRGVSFLTDVALFLSLPVLLNKAKSGNQWVLRGKRSTNSSLQH